jgi:uncharacterized caspase-like protein
MQRALLVGINTYPTAPLRGCVNDITDMADYLVASAGFAKADIRLLTDARATREGILERLGWLLTGVQPGDRVLFHYSGHGAQVPTRNPQGEVDGLDEVICPVDFDWTDEHLIRDKEFHRIFAAVPDGVKFFWISDSCHSQDLTKEFSPPATHHRSRLLVPPADIEWRIQTAHEQKITPLGLLKSAAKEEVAALMAGCESAQTSADANFNGRANGAFTYFLLQSLKTAGGAKAPLNKLITTVRQSLQVAGYTQRPSLEGPASLCKQGFLA